MENNDSELDKMEELIRLIKLDKMEELIYLITEFKNSLHCIEEFHLIVDRESRKVELSAKFQL
jgi:hypothetical protein